MDNFISSISPHIRSKDSTMTIMRDVVIALIPSVIAASVIFGARAFLVIVVCVISAVFFEWAFEKVCKKPITITDFSAVITGIILALNLPQEVPIWQAVFVSFVAIVVVKQLFGGLGHNFANPAITARIVMLIAFADTMTSWGAPNFVDAISGATPMELLKTGNADQLPSMIDMLLGLRSGSIGETCIIALTLGGVYLLARKVITWHIPVAFIGTVFLLSAIAGYHPVYQIFSGGLFIGAFFMATDYATTPSTRAGKIVFGVGCGIITIIIRFWGNYPEGVSFAILIMNILTPLIDKWLTNKPLGGVNA